MIDLLSIQNLLFFYLPLFLSQFIHNSFLNSVTVQTLNAELARHLTNPVNENKNRTKGNKTMLFTNYYFTIVHLCLQLYYALFVSVVCFIKRQRSNVYRVNTWNTISVVCLLILVGCLTKIGKYHILYMHKIAFISVCTLTVPKAIVTTQCTLKDDLYTSMNHKYWKVCAICEKSFTGHTLKLGVQLC